MMPAFVVDYGDIDALVAVAVWGPGDDPGETWRTYGGVTWWALDEVTLRRLSSLGKFEEIENARRHACWANADDVGAMLVTANLMSVEYHYRSLDADADIEGAEEPLPEYVRYWQRGYRFLHVQPAPTGVEGLKLLDCYEYQTCEHPEWPTSEAHSFCRALRGRLLTALPG